MLQLDAKEKKHSFIYTFNRGEHQSESYAADAIVCQNPLCICNLVHINFISQEDIESGGERKVSYQVSLGIDTKSIASDTKGKINENFANALVKDFNEEDWDNLHQYYYSEKVFATEAADLTELEVTFPLEDIESDSLLICYKQIISYARPVILTVNDFQFMVDDLYCVRPDCPCNDVHLCFIPIKKYKQIVTAREQNYARVTHISLGLKSRDWVEKEHGQSGLTQCRSYLMQDR